MKRRHFTLTLELGPDAVVRLLQLEQYATDLVGAVRDGTQLLSIVTTDAGAAFSTIARILEVVAPEAFAKPMSFEPMQGRAHKALSTALH